MNFLNFLPKEDAKRKDFYEDRCFERQALIFAIDLSDAEKGSIVKFQVESHDVRVENVLLFYYFNVHFLIVDDFSYL